MLSLSDVLDINSPNVVGGVVDVMQSDIEEYSKKDVAVLDENWFDIRFIPKNTGMNTSIGVNKYFSSAANTITSTKLGTSLALNPRAQFTPTADIPIPNRVFNDEFDIFTDGEYGVGRVYHENYAAYEQLVYFTFGRAKFNSLPDFFLSAIDYRDSYIANTGRTPIGYEIGKLLGNGVMLAAFPAITLTIWSIKFISKLALSSSTFKYYEMEPTMHLYWGNVSTTLTTLATELGILIPELMPEKTEVGKMGVPARFNREDMDEIARELPGIISENNYIDVYKIVAGPQAINNKALIDEYDLYENGSISEYDFISYIYGGRDLNKKTKARQEYLKTNSKFSFSRFLEDLTTGDGLFASEPDEDEIAPTVDENTKYTKDDSGMYPINATPAKETYMEAMTSAIDSGIRSGGHYAIFRVDYTGPISESFSNSTSAIGTGEKINQVASTARDVRFNISGGNIAGDMVTDIFEAGKNIVAGTIDSISFGLSSVVQTLTGNGFVDIPEKWDASSSDFPEQEYKMSLRRTYNNPFCVLKEELLPFAAILNGVLPLGTGRSSHTSPFLCEVYCKGVQHSKLALITSLRVERAVSSLGYDDNMSTVGMDISWTVKDLSSLVVANVNSSIFNVFNVALEDETPLNHYLSVVASRGLLTSKYMTPKIKLKASRLMMEIDKSFSPNAWGLRIGESLKGIVSGAVADHALSLNNREAVR